MAKVIYLPGVYSLTAMGDGTGFECLIQPADGYYVLIDPITNESLNVEQELLDRMKPQFLRKMDE